MKISRIAWDEVFEELAGSRHVTIERILSFGHAAPDGVWCDQDSNEWVVLLKGEAAIIFQEQDQEVVLSPGDFVNIPAHRKHRVEWTTKGTETIWLAIHY